MRFVIRPAAKDDVTRQFRYYLLRDAVDAGMSFLDAVDDCIEAICLMPLISTAKIVRNKALAGLRFLPVKGFDAILVFYIVQKNVVRIVRVLDGRRNVAKILLKETTE